MRDIKFRAWFAKDKEYIDMDEVILSSDITGKVTGWIVTDENEQMEEVELQQFTGLYDKNNKEVYEGDIVTTDCDCEYACDSHPAKILFKEGCFLSIGEDWEEAVYDTGILEVIGNIYENPELIKG